MSERRDGNRQKALDFYDLMFNPCRPADSIKCYAGDTEIQRNPEVGRTPNSFSVVVGECRGTLDV